MIRLHGKAPPPIAIICFNVITSFSSSITAHKKALSQFRIPPLKSICYLKNENAPYNTTEIPAAISAGTSFERAYFTTSIPNTVQVVTVLSLRGEANAPNVPLANTAPIANNKLVCD